MDIKCFINMAKILRIDSTGAGVVPGFPSLLTNLKARIFLYSLTVITMISFLGNGKKEIKTDFFTFIFVLTHLS